MRIQLDFSTVKQTRWHEFAVRFLLGGLITAALGVIGKKFGPVVGGLFLAFPVMFPASATLIDKHEKEKKQRAGMEGRRRARQLVSVDAAGTAMASVGLFVFALLISQLIRDYNAASVIAAATLGWLAVSIFIWHIRKRM
ncbi:MAG TPA: DUF3147 family protein [Candidatus Sulfotelmatobacter sp.]|nr:DUF3147 family protein [Candidatus Sulfotelmatobacter sp.]